MKKPELNEIEQLMYNSYKTFHDKPVYCALCGQEILWEPYDRTRNKTYNEYAEEMVVGMHRECYMKKFGR
jgi:hypothetical protein